MGEHFEGGITHSGEVWVWDTHRLSSAVSSEVDDTIRKNMIKLPSGGIVEVCMTKGFLWTLTSKGEVF
jgi:alpha-tubulin suppressor-like RCC1 family protein